ncbi:MAG: T9SS type A sorting domain-containing protein, partial [Polaribacter sp.]
TVTLSEVLDGVGRFYIHTSTQALGVSNVDLVSVAIYNANQKIHFSGLPEGNTLVTLYDVVGKVILEEKITESTSSISIGNISKGGIYLVHLKTEKGTISKKIVLQ